LNLGIFTIAYNGYGKFLPEWCGSIAAQSSEPAQVIVGLFGEGHGLSGEDEQRCREIMHGIEFDIVHLGVPENIGTACHEYPNIPFAISLIGAGAKYAKADIPCVVYRMARGSHSDTRTESEQNALNQWLDIYVEYFVRRPDGGRKQ